MPLPIIFVSQDPFKLEEAISNQLIRFDLTLQHPDTLVLSDKIGVEQIRQISEHLMWKSTGANKKAIVFNPIESITIEAQNGLLKMLEEPTGDALFLVGTADESQILPTVVSRSEIRYLPTSFQSIEISEVATLLKLSIEERLDKIEKNPDRKKLVEALAQYYYQQLSDHSQAAVSLKLILECTAWIKQHVPAKAVSDFLMISLPKA